MLDSFRSIWWIWISFDRETVMDSQQINKWESQECFLFIYSKLQSRRIAWEAAAVRAGGKKTNKYYKQCCQTLKRKLHCGIYCIYWLITLHMFRRNKHDPVAQKGVMRRLQHTGVFVLLGNQHHLGHSLRRATIAITFKLLLSLRKQSVWSLCSISLVWPSCLLPCHWRLLEVHGKESIGKAWGNCQLPFL